MVGTILVEKMQAWRKVDEYTRGMRKRSLTTLQLKGLSEFFLDGAKALFIGILLAPYQSKQGFSLGMLIFLSILCLFSLFYSILILGMKGSNVRSS